MIVGDHEQRLVRVKYQHVRVRPIVQDSVVVELQPLGFDLFNVRRKISVVQLFLL